MVVIIRDREKSATITTRLNLLGITLRLCQVNSMTFMRYVSILIYHSIPFMTQFQRSTPVIDAFQSDAACVHNAHVLCYVTFVCAA